MKKTIYTNEFKQEAVKLCISGSKSIEQIANDLGIKYLHYTAGLI